MTQAQALEWVEGAIDNLFSDFLFYDRKNDEEMSVEQLQNLMQTGVISKEKMIELFTQKIEDNY